MEIKGDDWVKVILGIRKKLSLSQTKLAEKLRINRRSISRFEAFQRIPSQDSSKKIIDFISKYNLDVEELKSLGQFHINDYKQRQKIVQANLEQSNELAELIGIILGDGELRPDCIRVSFNNKSDIDYLQRRIIFLLNNLLERKVTFESEKRVHLYDMSFVRYLREECNIQSGSKSRNNSTIPKWCMSTKEFSIHVVRGLFDTDGYIGYVGHSIKVQFGRFTDKCTNLVKDIRFILDYLEIRHRLSHTKDGRFVITISGIEDVLDFFNKVGSSNLKHIVRFLLWRLAKYQAKIEIEEIDFLISKLNGIIEFNIRNVALPFVWNGDNIQFIKFIEKDLSYLESVELRRKYLWDEIFRKILNPSLSNQIAEDLGITERSVRKWREGTRIPSTKFIPYLIEVIKEEAIDIESFKIY